MTPVTFRGDYPSIYQAQRKDNCLECWGYL